MATIYPYRTIKEHTDSLASYLPGGDMFCAKWIDGTNLRGLLQGIAPSVKETYDLLNLISIELDPHKTLQLLPEWEDALGIPDDCFISVSDLTIEQRRTQVLAKLYGVGVSTAEDFEAIGALFGFNIKVVPGVTGAGFPFVFPIQFVNAKTARFTILVLIEENVTDGTFPYTFPIQFGNLMLGRMRCFFEKLASVNTIVQFIFVQGGTHWEQLNSEN